MLETTLKPWYLSLRSSRDYNVTKCHVSSCYTMPYLSCLLILLSKGLMHETLDHHYNLVAHTVYINSLDLFWENKIPFAPIGSTLKTKRNWTQYKLPGNCHPTQVDFWEGKQIKPKVRVAFVKCWEMLCFLSAVHFVAVLQRACLLSADKELKMSCCPKPINSHLNGCGENGSKGYSDILLLNLIYFL